MYLGLAFPNDITKDDIELILSSLRTWMRLYRRPEKIVSFFHPDITKPLEKFCNSLGIEFMYVDIFVEDPEQPLRCFSRWSDCVITFERGSLLSKLIAKNNKKLTVIKLCPVLQ